MALRDDPNGDWRLPGDADLVPEADAPRPGWWRASDGRWYPPQSPPRAAITFKDVIGERWYGWTALSGAALLLIGPFLHWVTVNFNNGFANVSVSGVQGIHSGWGAFTLLVGLAVVALWLVPALAKMRPFGFHIALLCAAAVEMIALLIVFGDLQHYSNAVQVASEGGASITGGPGLVLSTVGALAVLVPAIALVIQGAKGRSAMSGVRPATPHQDPWVAKPPMRPDVPAFVQTTPRIPHNGANDQSARQTTTVSARCANGHPVGGDEQFCSECGAPVTIRCANGHTLTPTQKFCPQCGAPKISRPESATPSTNLDGNGRAGLAVDSMDVDSTTQRARERFDAQTAKQVVERLPGLSEDALRQVGSYERQTKARVTILDAVDRELARRESPAE